MQNKSLKLNPLLLIIVIILLAVGIWVVFNFENNNFSTDNNQISNNFRRSQKPGSWNKSQLFGLIYPNNAVISETYRTPEGHSTIEFRTDTQPEAIMTFGPDPSTIILWGEKVCTTKDFPPFEYGVSQAACVKGYESNVENFDTHDSVEPDDLKIFGDFVLKNK